MRFLRPMMVVWLLGAAAVAGAQQAAPASPASPDGAPLSKGEIKAIRDFKLLDFSGSGDDFQVSDEDVNIGISVMKGNTALKDALNSVLTTMTADDFNALMAQAVSVQPIGG